jgi:hypothetical protein
MPDSCYFPTRKTVSVPYSILKKIQRIFIGICIWSDYLDRAR